MMLNPNVSSAGRDDIAANYQFAHRFPTRENCDPANPREAFLWMLVALPGVNGAMLTMPISYNMFVSEHLWECGARPVAEPVKRWEPPRSTDPHWMSSPGRWRPISEPSEKVEHPADVALSSLTMQQRAELFERLKKMHENGDLL